MSGRDEPSAAQRLILDVQRACHYDDRKLGAALGVSRQKVGRWRRGDFEPPLMLLPALRELLALALEPERAIHDEEEAA